ncbi:MAG: AraC family transcriptional regulator, partial [Pseudomonadota bacterium]
MNTGLNNGVGAAALIGLSLSSLVLLTAISWMANKRHEALSVRWLIAISALIALQSLEFLYHATNAYVRWPFFLKAADPLVVLLPMCLYGYIRSLLGNNILASRFQAALHLLPALIVALLDIPYWLLPAEERIYWMQQVLIDENRWQPLAPYGNYYLAIVAMLSLVYWWRQQQLGYPVRKTRLKNWVAQMQVIQLIIAASLLLRILLSELVGWQVSVAFALAPSCGYLVYLILSQSQLPQPARLKTPPDGVPASPDVSLLPGMASSKVAEVADIAVVDPLFIQLQNVLQQGAFRDNELSLGKLAQQCGISTHQASAAINQGYGSNFYDWVNQQRIEAAKQALTSSDEQIARICFEVGFNSKSTFNTAFRRMVGCTPSEY